MDETDWSLIDFSEPNQTAPVKAGAVSHCPKCGKALKPRGQHFHIRKCEGPTNGDANRHNH